MDGRDTEVVLLDERVVHMRVSARLLTRELLDIIASHCALRAPDSALFGVTYTDQQYV